MSTLKQIGEVCWTGYFDVDLPGYKIKHVESPSQRRSFYYTRYNKINENCIELINLIN